ncbi:fasciclin domain-containing protein [Aurantiacibacter hainanensis]|uniref:fasciclin domain-containing protein n=1 Tax=Aurantiacibacter hainanensis TaxID=3076114 RepID=UPI0030C6AC67
MSQNTRSALAALLAAGALFTAAPALAHNHNHDHHSDPDIVAVASGNEDFETLVAAVQAAGLVDTLQGDGPFTVFAPTDAAFEALPEGTVPTLLQSENRDQLTGVLTYHVVAGRVSADDLAQLIRDGDGQAVINTVAGETLVARLSNGNIVLTDGADRQVQVTAADIDAANGVIHVLDGVLLPG